MRNLVVTGLLLVSLLIDGAAFGRNLEMLSHILDHHSEEYVDHHHEDDQLDHDHSEATVNQDGNSVEQQDTAPKNPKYRHSHRLSGMGNQWYPKKYVLPMLLSSHNELESFFHSTLSPREHFSAVFRPPIELKDLAQLTNFV